MNKFNIKRILLPTDFSDLNLSAFKVAVAICKRQNAKLTLLYVHDNTKTQYAESTPQKEDCSAIEKEFSDLAKRFSQKKDIMVDCRFESGNISDKICSIAKKGNYDIIVIGRHGISGQNDLFIGSNAFNVIKCAPCPVLTIPGKWDRNYFKTIVFPVRLITGTLEKYEFVKPIVEKNQSEIIITGLADGNNPNNVLEISNLVDKLKVRLHNDDVKFTTKLFPTSDFPLRVLETANENDVDLIVISSDIDYEYKEYLRGPYTQQIINNSKRPVLSIRPKIKIPKTKNSTKSYIKKWGDKYLKSLD